MPLYESLVLSIGRIICSWFLFSLGLWRILGKTKSKWRWMTWIPCIRYVAFGNSIEMLREGIIFCVVELIRAANTVALTIGVSEAAEIGLSLANLVLLVLLIVYRIRLFLRLLTVFDMKKSWLILWLFAPWLALLIIGFGKRYQPRNIQFNEDWEAGTAPAELSGVDAIHGHTPIESGLSVDLRERTVKELGKKRYLLKDIALDIPNGSMVLLLGGSGSGKTTLVNAIIGYEKADATVTLNGSDIYKDYAHMKYRIGFVPQKNLIRGNDTVMHTVFDASKLRLPDKLSRNERKNKTQDVMDLLNLSAGADGLVSKKSGGQLRRISIAIELVSDLELFVLDEPDSGLDGIIAREIFAKLRTIADEGKIVIVISHTPDRVIDLFDKVIVLARDSGRVGRLAFYGSPQEARDFFEKETMEGVVMRINRKEEGGDGLADMYIERYAQLVAAAEGADVLKSADEAESTDEAKNDAKAENADEAVSADKAERTGETENTDEAESTVETEGGAEE